MFGGALPMRLPQVKVGGRRIWPFCQNGGFIAVERLVLVVARIHAQAVREDQRQAARGPRCSCSTAVPSGPRWRRRPISVVQPASSF